MTHSGDIEQLQANLERITGVLRHARREALIPFGLLPIHFEVLHYVGCCNRYSDTPGALTEYLGQTKGSVSQTLKVLEKNALVSKVADTRDRRVVHLKLTAAGRKILHTVSPSVALDKPVPAIQGETVQSINNKLTELLRVLQVRNQRRSFGQCFSCKHHIRQSTNKFRCGLTGEPLTRGDIGLICREHASAG